MLLTLMLELVDKQSIKTYVQTGADERGLYLRFGWEEVDESIIHFQSFGWEEEKSCTSDKGANEMNEFDIMTRR